MALSIQVEWLDAPGVEDIVDSALWARLEISARAIDGTEAVLTAALDASTGQVRRGVYGSVYPLARWVADSYWHLAWEIPRLPSPRPGREAARFEHLRPWLRRHNLLAAREGFSLPDVTIARDGEHVVLAAFPDRSSPARRPVTFITNAILRLDRRDLEASLRSFMDAVLERLRGVDHPDAERLREDWEAVVQADGEESRLCSWAARLGIDPYDERELDDRLAEFILDHLHSLPEGLRTDFLDAVGADELAESVAWLEGNTSGLRGLAEPRASGSFPAAHTAHETGYLRARFLRRELGLGASERNVVGAVGAKFGFDFRNERAPSQPAPAPLESLVGGAGARAPLLVGDELAYPSRVFRWARALYLWRFGHLREGPRLLTRSHERVQRESRAFAAELLAPAAALRKHVRRATVDEYELAAIAEDFGVNPSLIRHQLENHGLAVVG